MDFSLDGAEAKARSDEPSDDAILENESIKRIEIGEEPWFVPLDSLPLYNMKK